MNRVPSADEMQRLADAPGGNSWPGKKPGTPIVAPHRERVLLELAHAQKRCELAAAEIAWLAWIVKSTSIGTQAAIDELGVVMDDLVGIAP